MLAARAADGDDRIDLPDARQRWTTALDKVSGPVRGADPAADGRVSSTAAPTTRAADHGPPRSARVV
ncbi:hypothetical protein LV779_10595 [Streptomyces thinghirensis]|nr:hypothetical protein [Streptomyces thinghirensis]